LTPPGASRTIDVEPIRVVVNTSMPFKRCVWPLAITLFFPAAFVPAAATLGAQSLAEVARQEEARRKEIRQPAKVYTNKDLANVPPPSVPAAAPSEKPASPAAAEKDDAKEPPPAQDGKDTGGVKDQKYWSGRMQALVAELDRDQVYSDAMQSRINGLTADFTARDDPAQRAVIARDRQKAVDELDRLKLAMQRTRKAIADLEEEARRASVPPGWLR
jgi:hypothetical protein